MPEEIPEHTIENGVYYLLKDEQLLVEQDRPTQHYQHYAELIVNQKGLEYSSQIQIPFDPVYESLSFHVLRIVRNGEVIDKLSKADIQILQREKELENLIYSGKLTANIILDDVRIGDVIEYSYTTAGDNPIYNGLFSQRAYTQWRVPLEQRSYRLIWKKHTDVHFTSLNTDIKVSESAVRGSKEYSFSVANTQPLVLNSETPPWHYPYGVIFFSEAGNWSEVVDWALPLYKKPLSQRAGVAKIAQSIRRISQDREQQIVEALKYVQEEIRYMGIETGTNSHRPSPAFETLQRRYGDCKDKTVLYISILDELGIKAYPALVNTNITKLLEQYPPYVNAFNHVIALVEHDGKQYWFDPTREYQFGTIEEIYQPNYGFALVVRTGTNALSKMDIESKSGLIVSERFDLTQGPDKPAIYTSKSEYYGHDAESKRNYIATNGLVGLEKGFTQFYKKYYPGIERKIKMSIDSQTNDGHLVLDESFLIKDFWEADKEDNRYLANFYANSISSEIEKPSQLHRDSPFHLKHPNNIWQNIEVKFDKQNWEFDDESYTEDNPFFRFEYKVQYNKNERKLHLQYSLEVKTDVVAVDDLETYLEARENVLDYTSYGIYDSANFSPTSSEEEDVFDLKLILFLLVCTGYCLAIALIILSWKLEARKALPSYPSEFYPVSLIKLCILTVVTFGVYEIYWAYRNWKYVKEKEASAIMPVIRGIFSYIWYYPFYKKLVKHSEETKQTIYLPHKVLAITLAIIYLLSVVASHFDYFGVPSLILGALLIIPLANYINHVNQENIQAYQANSRWRFGHYLLVVFFLPIIFVMYAAELYLLPKDDVIDGKHIWKHDIKFMQRKGIVPADEDVILFYSDAILDIRKDGNGFTKTQVFSYWVEDGTLETQRAALKDVNNIKTDFAKDSGENTTFTVILEDGEEFILFASAVDDKDRQFDRQLRKLWRIERANNGDVESLHQLIDSERLKQKPGKKASITNSWLEKAVEAGSPMAQYELGIALLGGIDGKEDKEQGLSLIHKAAENQYSQAEIFIGDLYSKGIHFSRDASQALYFYEQALSHKHPKAAEKLAWHLSTLNNSELRDGKRAVELISKQIQKKRTKRKLKILAAAYAEIGDFENSIATHKEALSLNKENDAEAPKQDKYLKSYAASKPWRETWSAKDINKIEYLPIFKPQPKYPRSATSKGIEGWVITEYDIQSDGSVSNIRIVEAEPKDVFDKVSLEATQGFVYFPRIIEGKKVKVTGVRNRFTFRMASGD